MMNQLVVFDTQRHGFQAPPLLSEVLTAGPGAHAVPQLHRAAERARKAQGRRHTCGAAVGGRLGAGADAPYLPGPVPCGPEPLESLWPEPEKPCFAEAAPQVGACFCSAGEPAPG